MINKIARQVKIKRKQLEEKPTKDIIEEDANSTNTPLMDNIGTPFKKKAATA